MHDVAVGACSQLDRHFQVLYGARQSASWTGPYSDMIGQSRKRSDMIGQSIKCSDMIGQSRTSPATDECAHHQFWQHKTAFPAAPPTPHQKPPALHFSFSKFVSFSFLTIIVIGQFAINRSC
jgi:hypothetical protein